MSITDVRARSLMFVDRNVSFPLFESAEMSALQFPPITEAALSNGSTRVLLVEADAAARLATAELLAGAGYEVVVATEGVEGLRSYFSRRPDAVVTSAHLPDMEPFGLLRAIRGYESAVSATPKPVILTLKKLTAADIREGDTLRANDIVLAPFSSQRLLRSLALWVARSPAHHTDELCAA